MDRTNSVPLGLKIFSGVYLVVALTIILLEAHPGGGLQGIFSIMVSLPSFILLYPLMFLREGLPESIPEHVVFAAFSGLAVLTNLLLLQKLGRKLGRRKTTI